MAKSNRSVVTKYTTKKDGVYIPPGITIELDPEEAFDKLQRSLVREPQSRSEEKAARPKPGGEHLLKAIALKIPELDKDDREQWTADNKPHTRALAELLGYPVSAKERDEAVAYLKENEDLLSTLDRPAA